MTSAEETDFPYAAAEGVQQEIEQETELDDEISSFWEVARVHAGLGKIAVVGGLTVSAGIPPVAWAFGDNQVIADELLALVLAGTKTGTSSALSDFDAEDSPQPVVGELSIILDGRGHPAALIRTTEVEVVAFEDVDAGFAAAEGEDDRSLESWRAEHTTYFLRTLGVDALPEDFQLVTERFELLYPAR
ncbi:Uncharacterized protein YhfF [Sanguibacter gelidistatuariae]|uniref:Uncharacterized protein YhfF n=1 Tax=Sanguibacter gelidistatuariae TaxID=1814289 RepID=A0A1G6W7P0_9MICO|nr:ASCH domain-containing protein [Sanguibacter gelidistatuariae]SDD61818.1 Uncharacterized protein YhfF [Sanguibacter gelidistatuariae]